MEEGRKILFVFLIVLFIIIALGVSISRVAKDKADIPIIGGSLEKILFPNRPDPEPTVVIAEKSDDSDAGNNESTGSDNSDNGDAPLSTSESREASKSSTSDTSKGGSESSEPVVLGTDTDSTTKGGTDSSSVDNAESIPATGTPAIYLGFALASLASGIALKRQS